MVPSIFQLAGMVMVCAGMLLKEGSLTMEVAKVVGRAAGVALEVEVVDEVEEDLQPASRKARSKAETAGWRVMGISCIARR
jgi:hypothetical protein